MYMQHCVLTSVSFVSNVFLSYEQKHTIIQLTRCRTKQPRIFKTQLIMWMYFYVTFSLNTFTFPGLIVHCVPGRWRQFSHCGSLFKTCCVRLFVISQIQWLFCWMRWHSRLPVGYEGGRNKCTLLFWTHNEIQRGKCLGKVFGWQTHGTLRKQKERS